MMMNKRRFLPIAAIAAVALAAAACSSGDDDAAAPEEVAFADAQAGTDVEAGTYTITGASAAFEAALEAYEGPTDGFMTGDTVTIGGIVLTCSMGPCSVTVAPDGSHFTTTGTINAMAAMDGMDPDGGMPMASACDAGASQACVDEKKAALTKAENALKAAEADGSSTLDEIKAAKKAVTDAMDVYDKAKKALPTYMAAQSPTYDMKAMSTAIKAVIASTTADTPPAAIDGGAPMSEADKKAYPKGTWPVAKVMGFDEAVYQSKTADIVTYTDKSAPKGAKFSEYYVAEESAAPTDAIKAGYTNKPWVGISNTGISATGVITLEVTGLEAAEAPISFPHGITGADTEKTFNDDDTTTAVDERVVKLKGTFHGVPGTYNCGEAGGTACSAGTGPKGTLDTLTGGWTFTPDANTGDMMVAGVLLDADYLDFGYWVTTMADPTSYTVGTFAGGMSPTAATPSDATSATYKGGAAGLYTMRESSGTGEGDLTGAGRFTADANLKAYFGTFNIPGKDGAPMNVSNSIRGAISNFMDGGQSIDATWRVNLVGAIVTGVDAIVPPTGADAVADNGLVSATIYGGDADTAPTAVSGEFDATFNNGEVIGAFGARKQ
jgi:hypothetical protein